MNKNKEKFYYSPPREHHPKKINPLFTRLKEGVEGLWRKLGQPLSSPPPRYYPSLKNTDIELKIAIPKTRRLTITPAQAEPRLKTRFKTEANLKKKIQTSQLPSPKPPSPQLPPAPELLPKIPPNYYRFGLNQEPRFVLPLSRSKSNAALAQKPAAEAKPKSVPAANFFLVRLKVKIKEALSSGFWRRALVIVTILIVAGDLIYSYWSYIQDSPQTKVLRIPTASLSKVTPLPPGFFELCARIEAEALKSEVVIKSGESLGKALENAGLDRHNHQQEILSCLTEGDNPIKVVRPGARLKIYWTNQDHMEIARLKFFPDSGEAPWQVIPKANGGFIRYNLSSQLLNLSAAGKGIVDHSLWDAGIKAGLDRTLILAIADLLASEIDFITDIKKGDSFQVLYSRDYRDGQPQSVPVIDLIRMINNGKKYEYYRYTNAKGEVGYYNNDGQSSVKTFFMTPLQYKRISSGFTMSRHHPIYKVVRPHQGVDYTAPSGTPVSAVAAGKVVFADWNRGFGRLVTIHHNATYVTMYGHLSSFAPGIKAGALVQQGDLIGRVGATGTATGPHLDFRLKKNGVFIDPLPELGRQIGQKLEGAEFIAFTKIVPSLQKCLNAKLTRPNPTVDPNKYKEELELRKDKTAENDNSNRSFDL
ncbi:MAG: hypothetical protein AMR96_03290 [Candidatus Adiutrix intracellularis]|jgi:murein DD-endopeptidase MepM/ murein hydrolase activator NlpD|nr:MAG: hypothetical protein AMR96_03290 [Candidatus Adiutrix intracellularis]MDR2826785.1 M23 family metallopeptidase [Candidatus Adiutrix intracellularis]